MSRPRITLRRMMGIIAVIALVLGAMLYALRPTSSTFSVSNRSGRPVSQLLVVVTDVNAPPSSGRRAVVTGESFVFRDLADGSTAQASFLSRGHGAWWRPARRAAFHVGGNLSDGTRIHGRFGFLPEAGSQGRPSFVIDEHGTLTLCTDESVAGNQ